MRHVSIFIVVLLVVACDDAATDGRDAGARPDQGPDSARLDTGAADAAADGGVGDAAVDARVPLVPDELPTEGEANLLGPGDLTEPVLPGRARAGRVDQAAEALTGVDARCRPGCFRLDNEHIRVCIQGESTFSQVTFEGGNIIDACPAQGPCADRLRELLYAPGLGEVSVDAIGIVRDGSDGGPAIIRTTGRAQGGRTIQAYVPNGALPQPVKITTEYRLAPGASHVDILTWVKADHGGGAFFLNADVMLFGDRTFPFFPEGPPDTAPGGQMPFLAGNGEEVAYRFDRPDGPIQVINIPVDSFPLRPITYGQLPLNIDDEVLMRRRFWVGPDIESLREAPQGAVSTTLSGPPGAWVDVDDGERQITRARLDAGGLRVLKLVPGAYRARALDWPGGEPAPTPFNAVEGTTVALDWPAPASLRIRVRDDAGRSQGAKVVLQGGGEERIEFVVGEATLALPAGTWRVVTSRGWHYTISDETIELIAGQPSTLDLRLTEVIPFDGWSAGEFHQHATSSLDSEVPNRARILSNIGEGVGFMVPSDHDIIFDFQGLAQQMGVLDRIALPLVGAEVSPLFGHLGAYGLRYDPNGGAGGAPPLPIFESGRWRVKTTPELVADARARGARFIQMNHPRDSSGWFDTVGYLPEIPVETIDDPNWTDDFETVEVYNNQGDFCPVLADWLGLLNQGLRITAVGNSDTHGEGKAPGYPRNYVRTAARAAHEVTADEISTAMQEGRSIIGAGAVLDFPFGPLPGDTVPVPDGTLRLHVRLRTPGYTSISRILAFHNGRMVFDQATPGIDADIIDHDAEIAVPVDGDGPVVVLALGNPRMPYIAGGPVFALANAVWADRDGDGQITAVGAGAITLPAMTICE